jgi:hypothetical protein
MTEALTLLLAQETVRIELDDSALADDLRAWSRGYVIEARPPWLTVRLSRLSAPPEQVKVTSVHRDGFGGWVIEGQRVRGELVASEGWVARGEVYDIFAASQLVYLCLSLLLPDRGVLLLHADTVVIDGVAVAFLGESGAGKSTTASHLVERAGAGLLCVDRTAICLSGLGAAVIPTPRLVPGLDGEAAARYGVVPLGAIIFPCKGGPARLRHMRPLEAHQRVLRSVIMPRGEGQPVARALTLVQDMLARVEVAELCRDLSEDVAGIVRGAVSRVDHEGTTSKQSGSEL